MEFYNDNIFSVKAVTHAHLILCIEINHNPLVQPIRLARNLNLDVAQRGGGVISAQKFLSF